MENDNFAYFGGSGFSSYRPADVASTLRSVMYKGTDVDLIVMSAGFVAQQSEKTRSISYEEEKSPTIMAGMNADVCIKVVNENSTVV